MQSTPSRVVFVDLLRFVAAFQMLQGHTISALLAAEYRHGMLHACWTLARGLTSVAFLFAAGLSFYLATEREPQPDAAAASRRRALRALRLIGLGYLLHLPVLAALSGDTGVRARALHEFAAVDVLQCIGLCLLSLEALRRWLRSGLALAGASLLLGVACLAFTPLLAELPADGGWRPLLAYLTPRGGSIFPLFPWAAHVFFGVACAAWIRVPGRLATSTRLLVLAFAGFCAAALAEFLAVPRQVTDPVQRLAGVCALSAALSLLGERVHRLSPLVQRLARETLFLYVFHVLLVYGQGVGLATWVGPSLSPAGALAMAAAVVVLSCGLALGHAWLGGVRRQSASR